MVAPALGARPVAWLPAGFWCQLYGHILIYALLRQNLHVFANKAADQAVIVGVLDNLGKGASGQAVQCMNLMIGASEETGLIDTVLL